MDGQMDIQIDRQMEIKIDRQRERRKVRWINR